MTMQTASTFDPADAKFVEVLTTYTSGRVFGYKLTGARPGPNILVAGHSLLASEVFDRMMGLPTLPWMRGTIHLVILDALDHEVLSDPVFAGPDSHLDEVLFLPCAPEAGHSAEAARQAYGAILRVCTRLGMIEGRGVYRQE